MDVALIQQIVFWAAVAFAAAFIGYFGKYLGELLMARIRGRRRLASETISYAESPDKDKKDYKLEKKRLKSEKKMDKKKRPA